jgi:hypothetical protein
MRQSGYASADMHVSGRMWCVDASDRYQLDEEEPVTERLGQYAREHVIIKDSVAEEDWLRQGAPAFY